MNQPTGSSGDFNAVFGDGGNQTGAIANNGPSAGTYIPLANSGTIETDISPSTCQGGNTAVVPAVQPGTKKATATRKVGACYKLTLPPNTPSTAVEHMPARTTSPVPIPIQRASTLALPSVPPATELTLPIPPQSLTTASIPTPVGCDTATTRAIPAHQQPAPIEQTSGPTVDKVICYRQHLHGNIPNLLHCWLLYSTPLPSRRINWWQGCLLNMA